MANEVEVKELVETPEFTKAIDEATTTEQIKDIIRTEAAKQGIEVPNSTTPAVAVTEDEKVEEKTETAKIESDDQTYFEDIVIGGKSYHLEGDSPADILRQIKAATTAHAAATEPEKKAEPAAKTGMTADEKVSLELDYRMGKISIDTYLEKTGALDAYLEKKGLNVAELKDVVQEKKSNKEVSAWEAAVDQFKTENPDWVPNQANQKIMGYKLAELGLTQPSAENLKKGFEAMKAEGLIIQGAAQEQTTTTTVPAKKKLAGSSLFGVGGGGGGGAAATTTTVTLPKITPDMSPKEIMRAYTNAAAEQGINPDDLMRQNTR